MWQFNKSCMYAEPRERDNSKVIRIWDRSHLENKISSTAWLHDGIKPYTASQCPVDSIPILGSAKKSRGTSYLWEFQNARAQHKPWMSGVISGDLFRNMYWPQNYRAIQIGWPNFCCSKDCDLQQGYWNITQSEALSKEIFSSLRSFSNPGTPAKPTEASFVANHENVNQSSPSKSIHGLPCGTPALFDQLAKSSTKW